MHMSLVPSFSGSKAVVPGLIRRVHFLAPLYCRALLQSGDSPVFAVRVPNLEGNKRRAYPSIETQVALPAW